MQSLSDLPRQIFCETILSILSVAEGSHSLSTEWIGTNSVL